VGVAVTNKFVFLTVLSYLVLHSIISSAQYSGSSGKSAVSGALGFFASGIGTVSDNNNHVQEASLSGAFGIGGDYEYFLDSDISVGALLRYYNTSDTLANVNFTNTLTSVGGIVRAYLLDTRHWVFATTGGLGFTDESVKVNPNTGNFNASFTADSGMTLGLYLGMSIQYKLTSTVVLGVENLRILGLGRGRLNGWVLSDYMAKVGFLL
jgi:hypothetical protein